MSGLGEQPQKYKYTGWLKLKYPTRQNAIYRQPCEIFIPKFLVLYGKDPATILKFKKKYFSFYRAMLCISAVYAVTRCLSVRLSVRHVRELRQNE